MRHLAGWIVVRTILVADVVLLVVSGFICLVWVAPPGGVLVGAALWLVAGGLLGVLPYTDPYRAEQRRYRRRARPRTPARTPTPAGTPTPARTPTPPAPAPAAVNPSSAVLRRPPAWPPPPATAPEPGPRRGP
jgi:hypothetical protein